MLVLPYLIVTCVALTRAVRPPLISDGVTLIAELQNSSYTFEDLAYEIESLEKNDVQATTADVIATIQNVTQGNEQGMEDFKGPVSEALQIGILHAWWDGIFAGKAFYYALEDKKIFFDAQQKAVIREYISSVFKYVIPKFNNSAKVFAPEVFPAFQANTDVLYAAATRLSAVYSK